MLWASILVTCLTFAGFSCGVGGKMVPTQVREFVPLSDNLTQAHVGRVMSSSAVHVMYEGIEVTAMSNRVQLPVWDYPGAVLQCQVRNAGGSPLVFDPGQVAAHHGGEPDPEAAEGFKPAYVRLFDRELTEKEMVGPGETLAFQAWLPKPERLPCLAEFTLVRSGSDEAYRFGFVLDRQ
jgi:hypothetical protein